MFHCRIFWYLQNILLNIIISEPHVHFEEDHLWITGEPIDIKSLVYHSNKCGSEVCAASEVTGCDGKLQADEHSNDTEDPGIHDLPDSNK